MAPHVIDFRGDGWTIRHPLSCRPNLFDCPVNRAAELDLTEPPDLLGRYECAEREGEFFVGAETADDPDDDCWIVPKVSHDQNAAVGPRIRRNNWISRSAGDSDVEHTRYYAAQLLAAADEAERRIAANGPTK
jgi:hypothetical protein